MKQLILAAMVTLLAGTAQAERINITTNLATPMNIAVSARITPRIALGGEYTSQRSSSSSSWDGGETTVEVKGHRRNISAFAILSPNQALQTGPFVKLGTSTINHQFETQEGTLSAFTGNYFICSHATSAVSSTLMLGFQWFSKSGFNASLSSGYRHNWQQEATSDCSNQDAYTESYYEEKNKVEGAAQLAATIGFAF
ncbi:hypothetical protein [Salinibius halmophilus]|uniref:hypothetical protein n=1 Tax=Salinibius halmophilus TaxID=1853216 RepID=UPI000E66D917|nr:hypothetical protein [Salinibius halmophilus]